MHYECAVFQIYPCQIFPDQLASETNMLPNRIIRKFIVKHTQGPWRRAAGIIMPPLRQALLVGSNFYRHHNET